MTFVGTAQYRAPEINEPAGPFSAAKAEVFAFASVLFTLFFEKFPFTTMATSTDPLYGLIMKGEYEKFFTFHKSPKQTVV